MSTALEAYKKQEIDKLRAQYKSDVAKLNATLTINIKKIQALRTSVFNKQRSINSLISRNKQSINNLTKVLNGAIAKINALQFVPRVNPDKFALLVGLNYVGTSYQLSGCINDVNNVKSILTQDYNYSDGNIVLLTDDTPQQPTKQNILGELTNMLKNSISGDRIFFQYSGHGSYTYDASGDEKDGRDETIVPIDLQEITDDQLRSIFVNNLKPGVRVFALFDSCHSGTVMDLRYNYFDSDNLNNLTTNAKIPDTISQVQMISGCLDSQTSADASFLIEGKVNYQGAMTNAFLSSLATLKQQSSNILLKSLVETMRTTLKNGQFSQIPQLSCGMPININTELFDI